MTPDVAVADPLLRTLWVAALALLVVLPPGTLLAWLLARRDFPGKSVVAAVVTLPLVLPPTAVGYLLLRLLADDGPFGGLGVLLTWRAAVLAAAVMALPLVVRTARVAFEGVDPRLEGMSRTLGRGPLHTFFTVTLPLAGPGLVAAAILGFMRAVGEFGATVILAGNIPGRTQTLASAIYAAQQIGADRRATMLLLVAIIVGLLAVLLSETLIRRQRRLTAP